MKHQSSYPKRFQDMRDARHWCENYVDWYNVEHYHSGLAGFTPAQFFSGDYGEIVREGTVNFPTLKRAKRAKRA